MADTATPRTDALFARHCAEAKENFPKFKLEGMLGANELAVKQVRELLEHARQLERELAECETRPRKARSSIGAVMVCNGCGHQQIAREGVACDNCGDRHKWALISSGPQTSNAKPECVSDLFASDQQAATGAQFSPCRRWRYRLWRVWNPALPRAVFLLMNPSTAEEVENDPTVERCKERVLKWHEFGFPWTVGGLEVVNAFAWRETDSKKLPALVKTGVDIIGPGNDAAIVKACLGAAIVVCGWGQPAHKILQRGAAVVKLCGVYGIPLFALKVNQDGSPCHPLFLPYALKPTPL